MFRVGPLSGERLSKEMQQYVKLISQVNELSKEKGFNLLESKEATEIEELKRDDKLGDAAVKLLELIEKLNSMSAAQKNLPLPLEPLMENQESLRRRKRARQRRKKKSPVTKPQKKEQEEKPSFLEAPKQDSFIEGCSRCLRMLFCPARFNEECYEDPAEDLAQNQIKPR